MVNIQSSKDHISFEHELISDFDSFVPQMDEASSKMSNQWTFLEWCCLVNGHCTTLNPDAGICSVNMLRELATGTSDVRQP